ncbi:MAG: VOC family protein [Bdellovibrio sp.]|nr:VOC family protein [Bdellovibrio sp.]
MPSILSHIALLVPNAEASAKILSARGIACNAPESFAAEGTKEIYVGSYSDQTSLLLLLEAISEGPYKRALNKRGPGLHHIAIDVLNLQDTIAKATKVGWQLHPESEHTMKHKTAWLFHKGVPLIEVQERKDLSKKPHKVSKIEFPVSQENLELFNVLGLRDLISYGKDFNLAIDGQSVSFTNLNVTE